MLSVNTFYSHYLYWECELGVSNISKDMAFLQYHNKCNKNKLQMNDPVMGEMKLSSQNDSVSNRSKHHTPVTPAGQNGAYAMKSCIKTSFTKQLLMFYRKCNLIPLNSVCIIGVIL